MSLSWRVFVINALVLTAAAVALVVSPLTVSFPVALTELLVLAAGLVARLVVNLVLLRRSGSRASGATARCARWPRRRASGAASRASSTTRSAGH